MGRSLEKRLSALEQRSTPAVIFVQYDRDRPGQPRQLADGRPVDQATFERQLASAGASAILIKVRYDQS